MKLKYFIISHHLPHVIKSQRANTFLAPMLSAEEVLTAELLDGTVAKPDAV